MPGNPQDPTEIVIRNLLFVQRFGSSLNDEVRARVIQLFDEVAGLLAKIDPNGPALQRYRTARAAKLFDEIEALTGATFDEVARAVRAQLASFGKQQAEASVVHLKSILGSGNAGAVEVAGVTINQLKAIVDTDPIVGAPLSAWWEKLSADTSFKLRREIQLGLTRSETIDQMVRRVRGRFVGFEGPKGARVRRYAGGVLGTTTRNAETIVRTAANHISNIAADRTFAQNADIVASVEWTCALDGRTCMQCAPLDGKTWKLDDASRLRPPLHPGDRCILVPVLDWAGLGLKPPPSGTRATALDPATGKPGQVSSDLRYEDWLKAQPAGVQNEILGPSRAQVFRDGKVSLAEMVRTDGGRVELRDLGAGGGAITDLAEGRKSVLPQLLEDEKQIVAKRYEYARAWDPETGERVLFGKTWNRPASKIEITSGDPKRIQIAESDRDALRDKILTHNHPSGAPFSPADFRMANAMDVYEIRAVGSVNTFSAIRPPDGWDAGALENAVKGFEHDWNEAMKSHVQTKKLAHSLWQKHLTPIGVKYTATRTPS